jgi:hypothetical protein
MADRFLLMYNHNVILLGESNTDTMTARLPYVGGDNGDWGTILNQFLDVAHNSDGSLQAAAIEQAGAITSVNGKTTINGSITLSASDVNAVELGGDLGGTTSSPTVAKINGVSVSGTPTSGQTLVASNGTTAAWNSIAGSLDWINVKSAPYNAAGNGSTDDTTAIQNALTAAASAGGIVYLPVGTYKTSSPLTIPSAVTLRTGTRGFGTPIDNYGIAGLPVTGAVLKPSASFSGSAVLLMNNSAGTSQMGSQQIIGVSIDGSNLPNGNTVHGIESIGDIAAVTLTDCSVYKVGGNGVYCALDQIYFHPGNIFEMTRVNVSYCGQWGFNLLGTADSYFTDCRAATNNSGGWFIEDMVNCRFTSCHAEWSGNGPGWEITSAYVVPYLTFTGCTSEHNGQDGWFISGTQAGTIILNGCHGVGDGRNNGSGGGGYAALRASGCASRVLAPGFVALTDTSPSCPQYGAAQVSSSFKISLDDAYLQGATAATYDDGSNSQALLYRAHDSVLQQNVATTGMSGYVLINGTGTILSWTAPNDGRLHAVQVYTLMSVTSATTGGDLQITFTDPTNNPKNTDWLYANRTVDDKSTDYPQWLHLLVHPGGTVTLTQNTALTAGAATIWAEFWSS